MARWKNTVTGLEFSHKKTNHDASDAQDYLIKEREVALKHPETGAIVKLTDDGFVDVFGGDALGVRIDPTTNSISLFGDNVNIVANNLNIKTKPYGFNWNGRIFNPKLYEGTNEDVMIDAKQKARYSEGMVEIMKEFGLPAESIDKEDI